MQYNDLYYDNFQKNQDTDVQFSILGTPSFSYSKTVKKVVIPEGVSSVKGPGNYGDYGMFYECYNLEEVVFPETLKYFDGCYDNGGEFFSHPYNLRSVTFKSEEVPQNIYLFNLINFNNIDMGGGNDPAPASLYDSDDDFNFLTDFRIYVPVQSLQAYKEFFDLGGFHFVYPNVGTVREIKDIVAEPIAANQIISNITFTVVNTEGVEYEGITDMVMVGINETGSDRTIEVPFTFMGVDVIASVSQSGENYVIQGKSIDVTYNVDIENGDETYLPYLNKMTVWKIIEIDDSDYPTKFLIENLNGEKMMITEHDLWDMYYDSIYGDVETEWGTQNECIGFMFYENGYICKNMFININDQETVVPYNYFMQNFGGMLPMEGEFSIKYEIGDETMISGGAFSENYTITSVVLPDTINYVGSSCFSNCYKLESVNRLPELSWFNNNYSSMFRGCTSLTTAPELSATTLTDSCYAFMFSGCESLTTAPELPATTLADGCYTAMFYNCTSLVTAPELSATTLTDSCYNNMFSGCTSLTEAPELPADELVTYCYSGMFSGCTSLTEAPELPAETLASYCYAFMFSGCSNLNYIKAMFITEPNNTDWDGDTYQWVNGVASTGTFIKNPDAAWDVRGSNGVPTGWTVTTNVLPQ